MKMLILLLPLLMISVVSASSFIDCTIFGNCVEGGTGTINNTYINQSNYTGLNDTLQSVTNRGNYTNQQIFINNTLRVDNNVSINPVQTNNVRMTVNNCTNGYNDAPSAQLQVCSNSVATLRVSSPNVANYIDISSQSSAGIGQIATGFSQFAFYIANTGNLGFKLVQKDTATIQMQGAHSSASGNGNNLVISGGQEGTSGNIYYGGDLSLKGGNSTNLSRLGNVSFIDAYSGAKYLMVDSMADVVRMGTNLTNVTYLCNSTGSCFSLTDLNASSTFNNSNIAYTNITNTFNRTQIFYGNTSADTVIKMFGRNTNPNFEIRNSNNEYGFFGIRTGGVGFFQAQANVFNIEGAGGGNTATVKTYNVNATNRVNIGSYGDYFTTTQSGYMKFFPAQSTDPAIFITSPTNASREMMFGIRGASGAFLQYGSGYNRLRIEKNSGTLGNVEANKGYFNSNVSVGKSDPLSMLDVAGNGRISSYLEVGNTNYSFPSMLWTKSTDTYNICGGTVTACSDLTADPPCSNFSGCEWGSCDNNPALDCTGYNEGDCGTHNLACSSSYADSCNDNPTLDCSTMDESNCNAYNAGCTASYTFNSCGDNPSLNCNYWNGDQTTCDYYNINYGVCVWNGGDSTCNSNMGGCSSISSQTDCSNANGCIANNIYMGCTTTGSCGSFNYAGCPNSYGCSGDNSWQSCGNSGSCSTLSTYGSSTCGNYNGCVWGSGSSICAGSILDTSCTQVALGDCSTATSSSYCDSVYGNDTITHIDQAGVGQTNDTYQCRDSSGNVNTWFSSDCSLSTNKKVTITNDLNVTVNITTKDLNVTGNGTIKDLVVTGNFSAKRPYYTGYDNTTQNFLNTSNTQIMNVSNNDVDAHGVHVIGRQNITFDHTGDYKIEVSPEITQSSGANKLAGFWFSKWNGTAWNDIAWSNSRWTLGNGENNAVFISFQVEVTNPSVDKWRVMWYSDSTSTSITSITGLTSPTRPNVPAVILNIYKISETW